MILKLTFNDNDFTQLLEDFINAGNLTYLYMKYFVDKRYPKDSMEYEKLICKNNGKDFSNTEKHKYCLLVREMIIDFILSKEYDLDTIKYLEDNLEISIVNQYRNKWENGEIIYFCLYNGNQYIIN